MRLTKTITWGDPTFYIRTPDPGKFRTFIKFSVSIWGCWIFFQTISDKGNMVDSGEHTIWESRMMYNIGKFLHII